MSGNAWKEKVGKLSRQDLADIEIQYDAAMENLHGSGDHVILMGKLSQYGFRTNGTTEAMGEAERIATEWYRQNYT